jgi:hypothetical protein
MQRDFVVVEVEDLLLENGVSTILDEEEEKPVSACQAVHVGVLAERVEVDLPHVKGLFFLLLFLEEIDPSFVDGPSGLVVICIMANAVRWSACGSPGLCAVQIPMPGGIFGS